MKLKFRQIRTRLERNERVLSGQAFKRGEESGSRQNSKMDCKMDEFTFDSAVRGYHVCQDVWEPAAGEKLHAKQEFDNLMDKFAVKVTKNSKTVGHTPREYSRISWYFCGGKKRVEVTGCRLHSKQLHEY